jgi:HlyD family secretion protein
VRGNPSQQATLTFVRFEPYVVPKRSLTGSNVERVDTRVLQVIYRFKPDGFPIHVGQQMDVFIEASPVPEITLERNVPKPLAHSSN